MKTKTFFVLDYDEFDKLVNKNIPTAKNHYEFIACEEARNDNVYSYENIKEEIDEWGLKDINTGSLMYQAYHLLCYLCNKNLILAGNYLIEVSW